MENSTIIAIDPGYDRAGVAVIQDDTLVYSDCIETNKKDVHEKRLAQVYETLEQVIKKWNPTHVAVETLFFSNNKTTAIKVAEARGVIILLAGQHDLKLIELSPQEVKLAMTGTGNADKKQVQKMTALTLGIGTRGKLDDEIDAIALGFAALGKHRLESLAKKKSI